MHLNNTHWLVTRNGPIYSTNQHKIDKMINNSRVSPRKCVSQGGAGGGGGRLLTGGGRSRLLTGGALAIVDGGCGALAIVDGGALAIVDGGGGCARDC